jgi:hypothetical protein
LEEWEATFGKRSRETAIPYPLNMNRVKFCEKCADQLVYTEIALELAYRSLPLEFILVSLSITIS